jgi:excisionase family DNA binding protein
MSHSDIDPVYLVTVSELAQRLGVSSVTLRRLKNRGMPFVQIGRSVRFDVEEVRDFFERGQVNDAD